ncbi:sulfotransferase family 2 domain-containing protein [Microbulbifer sp. SSSA002]|uniref:sulfotransferase family 2 domain-containing protein n=1 Tax=unclassified Microbulbifer TaxID=2619833 RepID=UPI0040393629
MKKKLVFIHIEKTAGNSIRKALKGIEHIDIGHSTPAKKNLLGADYFRFCFVRNPLSRLRSAFYHLVEIEGSITDDDSTIAKRRKNLRDQYGNDYIAFIKDEGYKKHKISHFFPQTKKTHYNGEKVVDFIGRVEDIGEDWKALAKEIDIKLPDLKKLNRTKNPAYKNIVLHIPEDAYEKVVNYYKDDFQNYGYSW